jgi:endogenous inhibitor of DNA gyrase (YacG/DUF329 family)
VTASPWEKPLAQLPFQIRPQSGEGARSFIVRLAQANHLAPSYLRKCLAEPPLHRGSPTWDRIAAATGRDPVALRQILETIECAECGTPIRPLASFGAKPRTCSKACRQKRYRKGIPTTDWKKVPCRVCGQLMRLRLGQRRHICSSHCRRIAFQFRQRGEPLPRPAKFNESREPADEDDLVGLCPVCERPMSNSTGRKACSRRCSARIAHWTRSPLPQATCGHCNKPLFPRPDGRHRRWCSVECRNLEAREERRLAIANATPAEDEVDPDETGVEPPALAGTTSCRGCHQSYRPGRANPWCSAECFEREVLTRRDQQECGACGTSIANRKPTVPPRKWCSAACQQRVVRWRAEFRARGTQTLATATLTARE